MTQASRKSAGPGLGNSTAPLVGDPFELPDGIELETPILAYSPEDPIDCDEKYPEDGTPAANGSAVTLCLAFRNTTGRTVEVRLPPGLTFRALSDKVQSGFVVQWVTIRIPPGERFVSPVHTHCLNQNRNTSRRNDEFELGPVLDLPGFDRLIEALGDKVVPRRHVATVQFAVTRLSNGETVPAETWAQLEAL
ncbi:hypothetical protein ACIQC9_06925 [Brevundimonas sp. NPDC092305]|uniref:hypothetical protein n=1 Tax=Brevundimonas sp. NPDC092305 TaxID=3363957 RepID=UPI0037FF5DF2